MIICTNDIEAADGVKERPAIAICYSINSQFNKYKLNYANVNRAGTYEHWKCEKCDDLFLALKELKRHKQEYHAY